MSLLKKLSDFRETLTSEYKKIHGEAVEFTFDCVDYGYYREFDLLDFLEFRENDTIDLGAIDLTVNIASDHIIFSCSVKSWPGKNRCLLIDVPNSLDGMAIHTVPLVALLGEIFHANFLIITSYPSRAMEKALDANFDLISKVHNPDGMLNIYKKVYEYK